MYKYRNKYRYKYRYKYRNKYRNKYRHKSHLSNEHSNCSLVFLPKMPWVEVVWVR